MDTDANPGALVRNGPLSLEAWVRPVTIPAAGEFAGIVEKRDAWSLQLHGNRLEFLEPVS